MGMQMLSVPLSSVTADRVNLPSTSSFLARKPVPNKGVFSPIIFCSGRCFNIHKSGCYMSSGS